MEPPTPDFCPGILRSGQGGSKWGQVAGESDQRDLGYHSDGSAVLVPASPQIPQVLLDLESSAVAVGAVKPSAPVDAIAQDLGGGAGAGEQNAESG